MKNVSAVTLSQFISALTKLRCINDKHDTDRQTDKIQTTFMKKVKMKLLKITEIGQSGLAPGTMPVSNAHKQGTVPSLKNQHSLNICRVNNRSLVHELEKGGSLSLSFLMSVTSWKGARAVT